MEQLQKLFGRLVESLGALRAQNRTLFTAVVAASAVAAGLSAILYFINPGAPVLLAANLAPADRTALALRLRRHEIPFTAGESSITVASRDLSNARHVLDQSPGFAGGAEDFSLFDRSTMGQSDFDVQVNYQRSLQGELERTIMEIRGIDSARVMIALGRPAPFALQQSEADHASVMITTAPGAVIDGTMASAIAHLVASSVRGLSPENVTIAGNDGAVLYPPQRSGELDAAMQLRDDFEHRLQEKVSSLLGRIMGDNRYAVAVTVDVDTSRVTSKEEIYGTGDRTILSEEHSVTPSRLQPGGIPGLTSNLPTPNPSPAAPAAAPTAAMLDKSASTRSPAGRDSDAARKDIVNYEPSSHEVDTVTAPVRIKRVSVAAVLDGTYEGGHFEPLPKDRLDAIKGLVAAAVGVDAERGDSVDIQTAALSQPYAPPLPNPLQQLRSLASNPMYLYGGVGASLLLVIGFLWMIKRALRRLFRSKSAKRAPQIPAAPDLQMQAVAADSGNRSLPPEQPLEQPQQPAEPGAQAEYDQVRTRINQAVERDPEAAAAVLRKWISTTTNGTDPHTADA